MADGTQRARLWTSAHGAAAAGSRARCRSRMCHTTGTPGRPRAGDATVERGLERVRVHEIGLQLAEPPARARSCPAAAASSVRRPGPPAVTRSPRRTRCATRVRRARAPRRRRRPARQPLDQRSVLAQHARGPRSARCCRQRPEQPDQRQLAPGELARSGRRTRPQRGPGLLAARPRRGLGEARPGEPRRPRRPTPGKSADGSLRRASVAQGASTAAAKSGPAATTHGAGRGRGTRPPVWPRSGDRPPGTRRP